MDDTMRPEPDTTDQGAVPARPGHPKLGWPELAVAAVSYLLLSIAVGVALYAIWGMAMPVVLLLALGGVATLGAVAAALALRARSLAAVGLVATTRRWLLIGLAAGVLGWLLNRGVVLGYMALTGDTSNPQAELGTAAASGALGLVGMLLAGALLVPFAEELLFRGIGYGALRRYGVLVAAIASSLVFGLAHGVNVVLPAAIVLGLLAALLYERSGSIWPAVVMHAVNNAIVFTTAAILL